MLEIGLEALLKADAGITAIVGTRIFPVNIPAETDIPTVGPCLAFKTITASADYTLDKKKWATKRVEFNAYSDRYLTSKNVLLAVSKVLETYTGTLTDGTRVLFAEASIETDDFEDDSRVYRCLCEYEITFVTP